MDEPHAAHVGRQLIDGIEAARLQRQRRFTGVLLPQIEQLKIMGSRWRELGPLEIHPANPVPFVLQPLDEVARDEAARSTH